MAASFNTSGDDLAENSEINVTPFIDVMLVLLIIFMVAAPLSTVDAPVDLPISTAKPQPRPDKPVFVTIKSDLSVLVGENTVSVDGLESALGMATKLNRAPIRASQPLVQVSTSADPLSAESLFRSPYAFVRGSRCSIFAIRSGRRSRRLLTRQKSGFLSPSATWFRPHNPSTES